MTKYHNQTRLSIIAGLLTILITTNALGQLVTFDINSGQGSSNPQHLIASDNYLFFTANKSELWATQGLKSNTQQLLKATLGEQRLIWNNKLYFNHLSATQGLWVSDGTLAGTRSINVELHQPDHFFLWNNRLYFSASNASTGTELWISDGTDAGTRLFKDLHPGTGSSISKNFTIVNNLLFFTVNEVELWVTDGTVGGTIQLKTFSPGDTIKDLFSDNQRVYFNAGNKVDGYKLYLSNGTTMGTQIVKDKEGNSLSGTFLFTLLKGKFFFGGTAKDNTGRSIRYGLFSIASSEAQAYFVVKLGQVDLSVKPIVFKEHVYFAGDDRSLGFELWRSDGTVQGTVFFKSLLFGSSGGNPQEFTIVGDKLFFSARGNLDGQTGIRSGTGRELWISDGTAKGTHILKEINSKGDAEPNNFLVINKQVYFAAKDHIYGRRLWVSDGTVDGTQPLAVLGRGVNNGWASSLTEFKGDVYFTASSIVGQELFRYTPNPIYLTFSPKAGLPGSVVVIESDGLFNPNTSPFQEAVLVKFNGKPAKVIMTSSDQLQVVVPVGATNGKISVESFEQTFATKEDYAVGALNNLGNGIITVSLSPLVENIVQVHFQTNTPQEVNVNLYSITGRQVLQRKQILQNSDITLDLSNLPTGMYILKAQVGKQVITHKIAKL